MNALSPHPASVDPVGLLLPRLERVRQYGRGWRADCPLGHSSRGTLSVAVSDAGHVLMTCFAGCNLAEITGALGIVVADLFPQRKQFDLSRANRVQRRELVGMSHWRAALGVLATESTVIEVAASMMERGDELGVADIERVRLAAHRIHAAREVLQ